MRAELESVYMDEYFTDAANTAVYAGHVLWNLRLLWQPQPATEVSLRVLNLTDRKYADRADLAFGNERYFPGEPQRAYVALKHSF